MAAEPAQVADRCRAATSPSKPRSRSTTCLTGKEVKLDYEAIESCERCEGTRAEPGTEVSTCEKCGGAGQIRVVTRTVIGQIARATVCDKCEGLGETVDTPCKECHGKGRVRVDRDVTVTIPAGISDGQQVRVPGRGHAGANRGPAGDLYVAVSVEEDERFHREGTELYTVIDCRRMKQCSAEQSRSRRSTGPKKLKIESGITHGDEVKIKGHGCPACETTHAAIFTPS